MTKFIRPLTIAVIIFFGRIILDMFLEDGIHWGDAAITAIIGTAIVFLIEMIAKRRG